VCKRIARVFLGSHLHIAVSGERNDQLESDAFARPSFAERRDQRTRHHKFEKLCVGTMNRCDGERENNIVVENIRVENTILTFCIEQFTFWMADTRPEYCSF
jgi:hypothetical protein